jgi:acyl-CoA synthetase (AMP-forming)/AMP-acid ligase II
MQFLASKGVFGMEALPHATPTIDADGRIRVRSASLFLGYWGDDAGALADAGEFVTSDLGRIDECGRLHVLGRADGWITTGGEKVDPGVVENAIRAAGLASDVAVVGVPDPEWGAIVVACVCGCDEERLDDVRAFVRARVSPHQIPKRWVRLAALPRNAAGKIDRRELTRLVATGESAP